MITTSLTLSTKSVVMSYASLLELFFSEFIASQTSIKVTKVKVNVLLIEEGTREVGDLLEIGSKLIKFWPMEVKCIELTCKCTLIQLIRSCH